MSVVTDTPTGLPSKLHCVFPHDADTVYIVRRRHVRQVPLGGPSGAVNPDGTVVMCAAFCPPPHANRDTVPPPSTQTAPPSTQTDCPRGESCPFLHVLVNEVTPRHRKHVRAAAPAPVPAFPSDTAAITTTLLVVQAPESSATAHRATAPTATLADPRRSYRQDDSTASSHDSPHSVFYLPSWALLPTVPTLLLTDAADGGRSHSPLRHCGHWLATGVCHFGADCRYVHSLVGLGAPTPQDARVFFVASFPPHMPPSRTPPTNSASAADDSHPTGTSRGSLDQPHGEARRYPYQHQPWRT